MHDRTSRTLLLVGLLVGCEGDPDLPNSYETEHLRIATDLDHPLCAGDLAAFEATIRRVEDELGFSMEEPFTVWIWSSEAWRGVKKKHCSAAALGCTSYAENAIYTSLSSVEHELVHAAIPVEDLTPFFAEGLADVYGGDQTRFGFTAPADNLGLSGYEVDRRTGRHFVRWLRETWGEAKLGELARLGKHADERFAEVYGLSFAEAQAMYFAEAPWGYQPIDSCNGASIEFADERGSWSAVVDLDCASTEDVRATGIGRLAVRSFVIPVAGHYAVSTDADAFSLSRCATGPIEEPLRPEDFYDDDVPPSYAGDLSENSAFYEGGPVLDLYFEAGKHEIGLFLIGYDEGEANLSIWPSLGPRPVEGGD